MFSAARHGTSVAVLAFAGMSPFETGIVVEAFGLSRPELNVPWYELSVCSEDAAPLSTVGNLTLTAPHRLDVLACADTVIVPGVFNPYDDVSAGVIAALRAAYERGARVVSICSGAFALAAAGLLDGRKATTHWQYADLLRRMYPLVNVQPDVLYVDAGQILTSAGSAAGLDLCLHLIRLDYGAAIANSVARRLVIAPHRTGGQAQFIESPVTAVEEGDRIQDSMTWALTHLSEPITLARLADRAVMSSRNYSRCFVRCSGTSPGRWVIQQRIHASLPLLEARDISIERVAQLVGFATAVSYRQHFTRAMRTSPTEYRRAFRVGNDRPGFHSDALY